jgi:hypothetical protein
MIGPVTDSNAPCPYCDDDHDGRYLCDAAKAVLDALKARGQQFNIPTVMLPEPVEAELSQLANAAGEPTLLRGFTCAGMVMEVGDRWYGAILLGGNDAHGRPVRGLLYAGTSQQLREGATLVDRMTRAAARQAQERNRR